MTEPENFDDDLFADLYDDNDASAPPASAPAPVVAQPVAEASAPTFNNEPEPSSAAYQHDQNEYGDEQAGEYEDDDDEVDFNLGNGPSNTAASAAPPQAMHLEVSTPNFQLHKPSNANSKEDGKMFIGGLNWETTDESLRDYFTQFGEVTECTVMRDGNTGRSRGFGFLTFKDPKTVNTVMVKEHFLDGKIIDPKRAIPRDEQEKTSKIFVGGVSQDTTEAEFKDYFAQFGRVVDATLMMDKDTGRPRGFGFVTFESEAGVDACLDVPLEIHGKMIEVKKAQPRGNMREEEENARNRNKFGRKNTEEQNDNQAMASQMSGSGGMTPQVMAQYWQRMQQYFAMMQQQMAMNRGMGMGGMNPAMMQMMQMQQMQQQMGQGGQNPMAAMANMSPQMMQQMQQQMQQMQQMGGNPMMAGGQAGQAGGGQGGQQGGFDNYGQGRGGGGRRGGRGGYGQGGYGMGAGGGGGGGGGGDPTSWEGMYDDVPQPAFNQGGRGGFNKNRGGVHQQQGGQGTQEAPPPNAPTGPKNAGRPGANYRGGGRGGSRGFHPYAR